jgi:DNA-directed RNA polymerase specialized sigma24 family protein
MLENDAADHLSFEREVSMNSVALPTTSKAPARRGEADLARAAARGDRSAFDELFRRHGLTAWRLATAVAADSQHAAAAVAEGFARSLRRAGRRAGPPDAVRIEVLAGVYRAVLDQIRRGTPGPDASAVSDGVVAASFRSLPERWRGALWLLEVEDFDTAQTGAVLGVSAAMARQLGDRGHRGLAGRLAAGGQPVPADLGVVLRPTAAAPPASLADSAAARWRRLVVVDPATRLAPVTALLGDRAQRTLGVAAGGLLAFGVIGLGVLGQTTAAPANVPVASGAHGRGPAIASSQSHVGGGRLPVTGGASAGSTLTAATYTLGGALQALTAAGAAGGAGGGVTTVGTVVPTTPATHHRAGGAPKVAPGGGSKGGSGAGSSGGSGTGGSGGGSGGSGGSGSGGGSGGGGSGGGSGGSGSGGGSGGSGGGGGSGSGGSGGSGGGSTTAPKPKPKPKPRPKPKPAPVPSPVGTSFPVTG